MPLVSVIIPVYNVEKYLKKCVDSVMSQTYRNLEIILVDDGSTDKCGEICDGYVRRDVRIKVIHKENGGLSSARNAGLDVCAGEYITFIDSDDVMSRYCIEHMVATALEYDADIVLCQYVPFGEDDTPIFPKRCKPIRYTENYDKIMEAIFYQKTDINVLGKMFSRVLLGEDRYPVGTLAEDVLLHTTLLLNARKPIHSNLVVAGYRMRKTALSKQGFTGANMQEVDETEKMVAYVKKKFPQFRKAVACRAISGNFNILYRIPKGQYRQYVDQIWSNIIRYRKIVLFDLKARPKARGAALLSLLGCRMTVMIGRPLIIGVKERQIHRGSRSGKMIDNAKD